MPRVTLATRVFSVRNYDLAATLSSGQAFRWQKNAAAWEGIVGGRWVRLRNEPQWIQAECVADALSADDWSWLEDYLQLNLDLDAVLRSFPNDKPLGAAVKACAGLRLLRQEPWECLASFILSSTKQIVQIQEIVRLLCARFGEPVLTPEGAGNAWSFPSPTRVAAISEADLRACKMGFRAPNLLDAARKIAAGTLNLESLRSLDGEMAGQQLQTIRGVGPKIAQCVLLFAYGFPKAFPVDVWVEKALRELYFPRRRPTRPRLARFIKDYFGPHAGYAQQYLFHYMRVHQRAESTRLRKMSIPIPR